MKIEVKIPSVGESVKEATLAQWMKKDGDRVKKDDPLFAIETDKVTLEVVAEADGILSILIPEGEKAPIGAVAGVIETAASETPSPPEAPKPSEPPAEEKPAPLSPAVRHLVAEHDLDPTEVIGTGRDGRLTKGDVLSHLEAKNAECIPCAPEPDEVTERKAMSPIRKKIAERLVAAKQNTAMLTTFNEIDMTNLQTVRAQYKEAFQKKYGVALGFMSFFIKACTAALSEFPEINAFIEGDDIVYHRYVHMGIAVGGKRGLVVPVIRHAEKKSYAELEQSIIDFVSKLDQNTLALTDLEGGTFTISNGGVYGSLLSTPILNLPQSGILGMHKIEKRPVVVNDEIVIRPMMYVALSYDHRVVDGREAVSFLKRIKEYIEEPQRIMLEI